MSLADSRSLRKALKTLKVIFICLQHGINPFSKFGENKEKFAERLSQDEKQYFIDCCITEYAKDYLSKAFEGTVK